MRAAARCLAPSRALLHCGTRRALRGLTVRHVTGLKGGKLSDFDVLSTTSARCTVEAYDPGGFVINDIDMRGSVLVFPNYCVLWDIWDVRDITIESLAPILVSQPEVDVLVVGCGERLAHNLDPEVREFFKKQGVVIELMNSVSACANFNILSSEGRNVAGALISVENPNESKD